MDSNFGREKKKKKFIWYPGHSAPCIIASERNFDINRTKFKNHVSEIYNIRKSLKSILEVPNFRGMNIIMVGWGPEHISLQKTGKG